MLLFRFSPSSIHSARHDSGSLKKQRRLFIAA